MFLVLEIVNDKGEKEWKVAPKRWVCTSKNTQRPVLFWPDEFSVERQNQLAIEGTFKPLRSWGRKECVIKQEFVTYDAAHSELQSLLALQSNQIKEEPEDPLNIEGPESPEPPSPAQSTPDDGVSTLASIKSMLETLLAKTTQNVKKNADVVEHNTRIESIIFILQKRIDSVESKFAKTLNVLSVDNSWHKPEAAIHRNSKQFFSFEPLETIEQLKLLDIRLNDASFNATLVQWLNSNIYDDNTRSRMNSCVNLLCSLELQTKMKWFYLVELHHFLNVLKEVTETSSERVSSSFLVGFFKRRLPYSKQRFKLVCLNRKCLPKRRTIAIEQPGNDQTEPTNSQQNSSERKFVFKSVETAEQLRELELKLNDESFKAELLQWLLSNVDDDNAVWRIKSCLDLLCSLELQSKLRWSRKKGTSIMKEPIGELPNFVNLFIVVGKTPSEDVSYQGLAKCFANHLKNSKQRYVTSLNRKRACSWRRYKKKEISKSDVDSTQVESSKDSDQIK